MNGDGQASSVQLPKAGTADFDKYFATLEPGTPEYKAAIRHLAAHVHARNEKCDPLDWQRTDLGNAERLIYEHGQNLLYCPPWKHWLVWDDTRWLRDETGHVHRYAKATVRQIRKDAAEVTRKKDREQLWKHAQKSEHNARLNAMVDRARHEPGVPVLPDMLDAEPMVFNARNGTLNLVTGNLYQHTRSDLITKRSDVTFDPNAEPSRFLRFLDEIFEGNEELISYVQRAVGYSMTGSTEEQAMFIPWGTGANGKTVLMNTVSYVLGDYSQATRPSLLMAKRNMGSASEGEAALRGSRFVSTSETGAGQRFDEATVKRLTGSDTIRARFLHQNEFEFEPTHKIWLATNHKPVIEDTDHAIWRRIHLIPFKRTFSKREQDPKLETKLKKEASGILNWMLKGCQMWMKKGLRPSSSVRDATKAYRNEMDILGGFLDEMCVHKDRATVQATQLYERYKDWSERTGEVAESQRKFGLRMTERGFERERKRDGYHYIGLGLRSNRHE